jgi:chemotaxis protein methyltransferase CheR
VVEIGIKDIKKVIDALYKSQGVNFNDYAFSSFKRRIIRFLDINKIRDLNEFTELIRTDNAFAENLVKEITVNVTEMFRDPNFWIAIRDNVLPEIRNNSALNIWHAACSSGEEVYSMAILLHEAGLLKSSKIVATDLNKSVLNIAEKGIYSLKSQETNQRNYLEYGGKGNLSDWYVVNGNTVQYDRKLIDNVEFRCHNLAGGGMKDDFDLILCRNVLIYFNSDLQEKVIQEFGRNMSQGSFLGIGSKESIVWCRASRLFKEESPVDKIYRRINEKEKSNYINLQESTHYRL